MRIIKRLYNDFLRPCKIGDYEKVIKKAKELGYEFHTIRSFEQVIGHKQTGKKYLILRRDVDTKDIKILRKMLEVEKKYGARCSYYFRLSTFDIQLMQDIEKFGGEASYHFEEIASFCYEHKKIDLGFVNTHMNLIRQNFIDNYKEMKALTGLRMDTVASHGDFINVKLGIRNNYLIDERVRKDTGIIREAYDREHEGELDCNIFDLGEKDFAQEIIEVLESGAQTVEWLTHPRQWNSPFWVNLKEEISRVFRGIYMNI